MGCAASQPESQADIDARRARREAAVQAAQKLIGHALPTAESLHETLVRACPVPSSSAFCAPAIAT